MSGRRTLPLVYCLRGSIAALFAVALLLGGCRDTDGPGDVDPHAPIPFDAEPSDEGEQEPAPDESLSGRTESIYLRQSETVGRLVAALKSASELDGSCEEIIESVESALEKVVADGTEALERLDALFEDASGLDQEIAWTAIRGRARHDQITLAEKSQESLRALMERCPDDASTLSAARAEAIATLEGVASRANPKSDHRPLIFRVGRPGGTDIYLFGSIHVGSASLFPLPDVIEDAYDRSDVVAVETNVFELDRREQRLLAEARRLPSGTKLSDVISEEMYTKVRETLANTGVPPDTADDMRPGAVAHMIMARYEGATGLHSAAGIEAHFLRKAAEDDKPVIELEKASEQISAFSFDGLGPDVEKRALKVALEVAPSLEGSAAGIASSWRRGDREALTKARTYWGEHDPALAPYDEAIFDRRDAVMTRRVVRLMRDSRTYFIIVGAGHIVGENSIVSRLRDLGHEVERL